MAGERPRDSQLSKVSRAVDTLPYHPLLLKEGVAPLDDVRRFLERVVRPKAVERLLGAKPGPFAVGLGRTTRATEDGVSLAHNLVAVRDTRILFLLAEHLALRFHPEDEPLHGWRFARLLLVMVDGVGQAGGTFGLRAAYRRYKVRHRPPRAAKPAAPAEIERLRAWRQVNSLSKLFGEAGA